jgi:hypothetical protein
MKHGNPATLDLRPTAEWEHEGSLRLGPDVSELGQKSISFVVTVAGQAGELELHELAATHSAEPLLSDFLRLFARTAEARRRLLDDANCRWSGLL